MVALAWTPWLPSQKLLVSVIKFDRGWLVGRVPDVRKKHLAQHLADSLDALWLALGVDMPLIHQAHISLAVVIGDADCDLDALLDVGDAQLTLVLLGEADLG